MLRVGALLILVLACGLYTEAQKMPKRGPIRPRWFFEPIPIYGYKAQKTAVTGAQRLLGIKNPIFNIHYAEKDQTNGFPLWDVRVYITVKNFKVWKFCEITLWWITENWKVPYGPNWCKPIKA